MTDQPVSADQPPIFLRDILGSRVRAECFMVCDAAQTHDGKIFILGGGWDRLLVRQFPSEHRFVLAVKLAIPAGEAYRPFQLRVDIRDEEGNSANGQMPTTQVEIARPLGYGAHEDLPCVLAFQTQITIAQPERLTFSLVVDGESIARTSLRVVAQT